MGTREPAMASATAPQAETAPAEPLDTGLLAGVDEAGLGPILGPLVVGGVAMRGPRGADPWQLLERRVCRDKHIKGKLRVADSKKVHSGKQGLRRLEETVLGFWGALHGELPTTLGDFLTTAGVDATHLARCPWYGDLDLPLPYVGDRDVLELSAHTLAMCLAEHGIEILHMAIRPVDVEEFNASIEATNNKSETHFDAYADVLGQVLGKLPGDAHLVADRCGGRVHYNAKLRQRLPGREVRTLSERAHLSTYELHELLPSGEPHTVKISFAARGEDRSFPTALASCTAKYVRELMMVMVNDWFGERIEGLKRTAGYYVDGNRFLQDVGPLLDDAEFPLGLLIRSR